MINGIGSSSFSSYSITSSATSGTASKKFQEELLTKLDTDGDGSIGKDELSTALSSNSKDGITVSLSQAFSDLDSNDDDSLDADELAAMTPPPPPAMPSTEDLAQDLLGSLDSDDDGAISSEELTTGLTNAGSSASSSEVFDALDTNKDGTVSLDELTASLQQQQPPAGPPPAQVNAASTTDSATLFSALDTDSDDSISATELASALKQSDSNSEQTQANQVTAQALSKMIAALGERYDTQGSKPVGRYLDTAA
ncbi:XopAW family type III secretion system calcium-binding effector [Pseudomonas triticifolii]|uniref:EF-hand domain-containing protein n=1 Tax=Pseudomonas triticifolii TaxID=2762592 RepID=A0ABR7BAP5_9PSED|nr:XopAW family type III secretion system calcium-binding effector [Pseudomonas triticifolii]MBC3954232.1 EF-hand domain-containing protein [Pseudomonas triticifolii]